MAGKRKIIRTRTKRKTRPKLNDTTEGKSPSKNGSGLTNEEAADHVVSNSIQEDGSGDGGDDKDTLIEYSKDDKNDEMDDDEEVHKNKYEVRQRVLGRDEDGILYYANIRRTLYGVNHQKRIPCLGIFDLTPEKIMKDKAATDTTTEERDEGNGEPNSGGMDESQTKNEKEWHYFVHFEGWKTLWDRWVSEDDILEITPENVERMKEISKTHKAFQQEFKEKTKQRKIQNGGIFLQQWKQRLDALNRRWDQKLREADATKDMDGKGNATGQKKKQPVPSKRKSAPKHKNNKTPEDILHDRSELAVKSCLTTRQPSHIQAIPLSFGLKRILVEDWENLNSSNVATDDNRNDASDIHDMVHVLPAKVTIRDALSLYLKEKGIQWDGKPVTESKTNDEKVDEHDAAPTDSHPPLITSQEVSSTDKEQTIINSNINAQNEKATPLNNTSSTGDEIKIETRDSIDPNATTHKDDDGRGISIQLVKEWTDMANGIVLYFEQSLMARLLYPSEISQILVMEDTMVDDKEVDSAKKVEPMPLKVDIYGCEHLVRLLAAIPRILDQHLQDARKKKLERKKNKAAPINETGVKVDQDDTANQDDALADIGSMILAKLQDLSRFLQKNQSALFRSMYRKKNEEEIKRDIKIQKRQDRRVKSAVAAAAAVASALSQNNLEDSKEQTEKAVFSVNDTN